MMAGIALIAVYLIILGGAKGIAFLAAAVLLFFLWPILLLLLILYGPRLKKPLGTVVKAAGDLLRHLFRPPDR